jgi:CBS domain containing-hemolysin-like protein
MAELLGELGGWERAAAHSAASIVVLVALSVLQMVLGELVPKGLALQFPERTALATVLPMAWSVRVLRPLIWVFNGSGLALLRLIGVRYTAHRHVHTPGEIDLMLAEGGDTGAIDPEGRRRLRRALRLVSRRARDFMVPRQRIAGIEVDTPFAQAARQIAETPYTRLLVYRGQLDQVVGSVHTKDVVLAQMAERAVALRELMGPVATVTPGATADQVLAQLRERRTQQAVVVDARRRVVGLVTLSDVLGEVFGSMADEVKVKGGARRARVRRETGRPG